jgi:tetratricopeptide (TPR) repeat protein
MGQLYQKQGLLKEASSHYQKVLKLNPPYEMSFNARINLARCYDSKSGKSKNIRKELEKMLKDDKTKNMSTNLIML